jgi:ATP-dependent DNA ligase
MARAFLLAFSEAATSRKRMPEELISGFRPGGPIRYPDHVLGHGTQFYHRACKTSVEGVL